MCLAELMSFLSSLRVYLEIQEKEGLLANRYVCHLPVLDES